MNKGYDYDEGLFCEAIQYASKSSSQVATMNRNMRSSADLLLSQLPNLEGVVLHAPYGGYAKGMSQPFPSVRDKLFEWSYNDFRKYMRRIAKEGIPSSNQFPVSFRRCVVNYI